MFKVTPSKLICMRFFVCLFVLLCFLEVSRNHRIAPKCLWENLFCPACLSFTQFTWLLSPDQVWKAWVKNILTDGTDVSSFTCQIEIGHEYVSQTSEVETFIELLDPLLEPIGKIESAHLCNCARLGAFMEEKSIGLLTLWPQRNNLTGWQMWVNL